MNNQINRFDFLRLLFAGAVAIYHAVFLSNLIPFSPFENALTTGAELAIQGFFVISGCLVLGSLIRSETLGHYGEKRIRRLYPAYVIVILIPALIALLLTGQAGKVLAYVIPNLGFLNFIEHSLPGLFEGHRHNAVNGALWTLKIEVMFYIALPMIWWMMKRASKLQIPLIILMMIMGEIWRYYFLNIYTGGYAEHLSRQLPGQIGYFAAGMALWLNWEKIKSPKLWWLGLGLALTLLSLWQDELRIVRPAGLAFIIAWVAFAKGPKLNAARYGDLSYGIYITHFPIIQMCVALGLFAVSPLVGYGASFILTLIASYALWHLVEKRALLPSSHYRKTS